MASKDTETIVNYCPFCGNPNPWKHQKHTNLYRCGKCKTVFHITETTKKHGGD